MAPRLEKELRWGCYGLRVPLINRLRSGANSDRYVLVGAATDLLPEIAFERQGFNADEHHFGVSSICGVVFEPKPKPVIAYVLDWKCSSQSL